MRHESTTRRTSSLRRVRTAVTVTATLLAAGLPVVVGGRRPPWRGSRHTRQVPDAL